MSEYGERLDLPLQGEALATCAATGQHYALHGTAVCRVGD